MFKTFCNKKLNFDFSSLQGFTNISKLKHLEELSVNECNITDAALKEVSLLSRLKKLNSSRCTRITDIGILYISRLKLLRELNLVWCTSLTSVCVEYIKDMESLVSLDIRKCNIVDVGYFLHTNVEIWC